MRKSADPIAQLMQEHDHALVQLKHLNRSVAAVLRDGYSAQESERIGAALRFIKEEVSVHNHKEETALFPVLERYVEGPTQIMRQDHRRLRAAFVKLQAATRRLERSRHSARARRELAEVAHGVVQMFVNHIHKENHILFPLVQRFLSKEELREIATKML